MHTPTRRFSRFEATLLMGTTVILMNGCFGTPRQSTADVFSDGKLPAVAESVVNPKPSDVPPSGTDKVRVGVMDCGVDYTHPDLIGRIHFDRDSSGAIIGAGRDVLGNDAWPFPNYMNASLLAFGGEVSSDGKIVRAGENPIAKIEELNRAFLAKFLPRLRASSALQGTFYTKVDETNVSFLAFAGQDAASYHRSIARLRQVLQQPADYDHFDLGWLERHPEFDGFVKQGLLGLSGVGNLRMFWDFPLAMSAGGGPALPGGPEVIKGSEDFYELGRKAYEELSQESGFESNLYEPYFRYSYAEEGKNLAALSAAELQSQRGSYFMSLVQAWRKMTTGFRSGSPMETALRSFCNGLPKSDYAYFRDVAVSKEDKRRKFGEILDHSFTNYSKIHELALGLDGFEPKDLRTFRKTVRQTPGVEAFTTTGMGKLDFILNCDPADAGASPFSELHRQYRQQTQHPLLVEKTDVSHGTHVSGIIASQSPAISIVPVRVLTEETKSTYAMDQSLKDTFTADFLQWIERPLIKRALAQSLAGGMTMEAFRAKFAQSLPELFVRKKLDFFFIKQVREAIRYAGEKKLKLVNISLGTDFEKVVTRVDDDAEQSYLDLLDFLTYEYFKFTLASEVQSSASGTLFVIAAGNNGNWVDGRSRSALPCDLSSPWLEAQEQAAGEIAPNHTLKNILCVGSMDAQNRLSSFSNLTISRVPYVLSYGEAIASSIRTGDCNGVEQRVGAEVGSVDMVSAALTKTQVLTSWLVSRGELAAGADPYSEETETLLSKTKAKLHEEVRSMSNFLSLATRQECLTNDTGRFTEKMSGTSMATPAVTGFLGRVVAAKLDQAGISDVEAYDRPEFSPDALIHEAFSRSLAYPGSSVQLRMITEIQPYSIGQLPGPIVLPNPTPSNPPASPILGLIRIRAQP